MYENLISVAPMEIELEESMRKPTSYSSSLSNNESAADFECNICLDLAQDPVVTLCGHLFCWPCLYRWLHLHSDSMHCPVCKAIVEEEKLVPLYGRGKTASDPRSKSIISLPNTSIPHRPFGQRPETVTRSEPARFPHNGFGLAGGYGGFHPPTTRVGNFTLSSAFGGLIPSLFNLHFHGFPHGTMHGGVPTFSYGYPMGSFHGGVMNGFHYRNGHGNMPDLSLKLVLMSVGIFLIILLVFQ